VIYNALFLWIGHLLIYQSNLLKIAEVCAIVMHWQVCLKDHTKDYNYTNILSLNLCQ